MRLYPEAAGVYRPYFSCQYEIISARAANTRGMARISESAADPFSSTGQFNRADEPMRLTAVEPALLLPC
jgi:hypothetical protein